jgi:DNA-binding protein H-NS
LKRLREHLNLPTQGDIKSTEQRLLRCRPYSATVAFGAAALGTTTANLGSNSHGIPPVYAARSNRWFVVMVRTTRRVKTMKRHDFNSMSVEELWALRSEISSILASRIAAEKAKLEKRLRQLQSNGMSREGPQRERRPYPQVLPKYRNPAKPAETWAGRGRQPRWVTEQLKAGKKLDDFRIRSASGSARRSGGGHKAQRA